MSGATGRSFAFLVNPAAGGGAAPEAVVPVARRLREAGADVEVTYSPGPRATRELVAAAVAQDRVVVSVGGDGMLASLAGEVSRLGGTLGLVPAGRGNDFARMLGIPESPAGQAELLLRAHARAVDLLSWQPPGGDATLVAGSVYAGVDARAAALVARMRRVPRRLQYPLAAVRSLLTYRPAGFTVVVDGAEHRFEAAMVTVANSCFYGKGMKIAPAADVADGLLDVVVVAATSKRSLVRALPTVYAGAHVGRPEVSLFRGTRVELSAEGRVPVGGDGEPLGELPTDPASPAEIAVRPAALTVVA